MYDWRKMTPKEREEAMARRRARRYPWHGPPHFDGGEGCYHLWAACYEHRPIIGQTVERIAEFESALLDTFGRNAPPKDTSFVVPSLEGSSSSPSSFVVPSLEGSSSSPSSFVVPSLEGSFVVPSSEGSFPPSPLLIAWCVLPNHYHLLLSTDSLRDSVKVLGKLHGRSSYAWNGEDATRGRKVWHRCSDRAIRNDRHFWATVNYIHHNPVKHGYVAQWQDWPYSSARAFLEAVGRERAEEIWRGYPLLDYGKGWDEFE